MPLPRKRALKKKKATIKDAAPVKRKRRTRAQMEEARAAAASKPVVSEDSILNVLSDDVELTLSCDIKSSVDYVSVGTSATLKTTVSKGNLEEAEDKMRKYLREKVMSEHRLLDAARSNGL